MAWSPSFSVWLDLGHWLQASAQLGTEHGLDTGNKEFFYKAALIYIFQTHRPHSATEHDHGHAGAHSPLGVTSGILEFNGRTPLGSPSASPSTGEVLLGASHNLTGSLELRGGYQLPVGGNQEYESGFAFGLVYHF
jgi:hypothetical protein